ncbi:LysR family transcriptional regulator [Streptomyces vietnamensis]|uniref:LysR family transcriptional regulator n=1 Tax=Streptomyces vietnamensis TaxID=362257 RepID=UPI000AEFC6A2|nr:LysR family transcriptional regulator [Streptomyces vietnamensis]
MELQHLRAFREVARELSFTRAAHNLHYSQPAVTAQIKGLEEDMGASLFQRRGNRSVELTPAGARLRPLAEQILELVETAQYEIADPAPAPARASRRMPPLGGNGFGAGRLAEGHLTDGRLTDSRLADGRLTGRGRRA